MPSIKLTRRDFLKLSAASAALASAGCSPPAERIVPYAHQPENVLPGVPRFYASAASILGAAEGVLVESNTGRPTKVEGNPAHPGSTGSTSVHGQASVLQLWDPDRSKAPRKRGRPATRAQFEGDLHEALTRVESRRGAGLRILIGACDSPTLAAQLAALTQRLPEARVHRWDPLHRDRSHEGARLAFGRVLEPIARIEDAGAILSLDSRFLDDHPFRLNYARQFAAARTPRDGRMVRLYALESAPSLTGAMADHRYAMRVSEIEAWLLHPNEKIWRDLQQNRGLILAGDSLSPEAQALVHRLNAELRAPVAYVPPVDEVKAQPLEALAEEPTELLFILGGNPAYDAPDFRGVLARVPLSVHLSLYDDETSALATWHLPATHFMEHWSDARAFDGTAGIVQPLIAPLYGGLSPHELLARLMRDGRSGHDIVRAQWKDIDWESALRKGVIAGTAFRPVSAMPRAVAPPKVEPTEWDVRFIADPSVLDGRFANNAWLQELPRSDSKITWDNAALLSPKSAQELGVSTGELLQIDGRLTVPAWIEPTHADRSITLPLGYGRTRAGRVGNGVGFDAYALRTSAWSKPAQVAKAPGSHEFATTQRHARMEGRDLARSLDLAAWQGEQVYGADDPKHSLYPAWPYDSYRWAMSINLNTCIGCNACTIACQAENNIPTVGKEQVIAEREMHWIRVDRYYEEKETRFQPVPCMHCENAPCEYVCPVEASVHDSEGLNVQVYNRCVGTRFCSQNCPYKVRRFNFLQYSSREETLAAQKNPEVTVRMRGVMEKCTYCVQRIARARIEADKEDRQIRDGEVITACQAACPTGAIVFGDLGDEKSQVSQAKRSPLRYDLLAELNTRPRTSYRARLTNRNPDLDE
jgi:molybdopterin-containing oxidoreductase family iron-sulfur binding subunit